MVKIIMSSTELEDDAQWIVDQLVEKVNQKFPEYSREHKMLRVMSTIELASIALKANAEKAGIEFRGSTENYDEAKRM